MDLVSNFLSQKNIDSEITFEKYIMPKAELNDKNQYLVKGTYHFNANNDNFKRHYDENKILEIHLKNMLFEQGLIFNNVKKLSLIIDDSVKFQKLCIFGCDELSLQLNGRVEIIDKISINNCNFKQISINNHIDGNIEFQKCEFNDFNLYGFSNVAIKGAFTFDFCEIKEKANFMNFEFKNKVSFKMSKFKDNAYFNNSKFYNYADFHECEFEKIACFYGVRFDKVPNFSACYFKESKAANLINVDIDELNFESMEKYIEDNYQDESYKNETKGIQDEKEIFKIQNEHQLRYAKNLKDSFRVIKDVLISQNNILEAQEWHKLELYAKEKETMIKAKSINDNIDSKNTTAKFLKEELYNFTEWINFTLLFVYRNTSNHHTSFLKILNFTVVMIALYASFLFWLQNDSAVKSVFGFIVVLAFTAVIIKAFLSFIVCKNIFKLRTSRFFYL